MKEKMIFSTLVFCIISQVGLLSLNALALEKGNTCKTNLDYHDPKTNAPICKVTKNESTKNERIYYINTDSRALKVITQEGGFGEPKQYSVKGSHFSKDGSSLWNPFDNMSNPYNLLVKIRVWNEFWEMKLDLSKYCYNYENAPKVIITLVDEHDKIHKLK